MKKTEYPVIFLLGGAAYYGLECLWRGHSHWTMALAGGVCLSALYALRKKRKHKPVRFCIEGALMITGVEFLTGCLVNRLLGWNVWDYSGRPLNLLGQVCPLYAVLWAMLCLPAYGLCGCLEPLWSLGKRTVRLLPEDKHP